MEPLKKGRFLDVHCCNDCVSRQGLRFKRPADSGSRSEYCHVCGHLGIGSTMTCTVGDWLQLKIQPLVGVDSK